MMSNKLKTSTLECTSGIRTQIFVINCTLNSRHSSEVNLSPVSMFTCSFITFPRLFRNSHAFHSDLWYSFGSAALIKYLILKCPWLHSLAKRIIVFGKKSYYEILSDAHKNTAALIQFAFFR